MVGAIIAAGLLSICGQVQDVEQLVIKRTAVNKAIAELRFSLPEYSSFPEESWPLHSRGVTFNLWLAQDTAESADVVVAHVSAQFQVSEGNFDLEILNAESHGYGYDARIDVRGDLEVRALIPLLSTDPDKCLMSVKAFAFRASQIAQEARTTGSEPALSIPPPPGREPRPKRKLDENKTIRFLAPQDLNLLVSEWGMKVDHGYAGSSVTYWLPYQFNGFELTIHQPVAQGRYARPSLLEALSISHTIVADDSGMTLAELRSEYREWEFTEQEHYDGQARLRMETVLEFKAGVTLGTIRRFLERAAVEAKKLIGASR